MDTLLHDMNWVVPLRSEAATAFFYAVTSLGHTPFVLLLLSLGYWIGDKKAFTRLAVLVLATAIFNAFLKDWFQDPRPDPRFVVDGRVLHSFGMPSGHAQVSVVLWFWLAYETRRARAYLFASVMVALIIFSRLYLGVHDVEDVTVGALLGAGGLLLFRAMLSPSLGFWRTLNPWVLLALVVGAQLAVFAAWPGSGPPAGILSTGGLMTGWLAGVEIDRRYVRFRKSDDGWRVALCGIAGAAVILLLLVFEGPRASSMHAGPSVLSYAKAMVLGSLISVVVPLLFQKLGLAGRIEKAVPSPVPDRVDDFPPDRP